MKTHAQHGSRFAVMALGRLGTSEFDLLSDADVLFVCDNHSSRAAMSRTAELLMEALTAYTREGSVFPIDTRLRPNGREGALVQVVDVAKPAERKSAPKRLYIGIGTALAGMIACAALISLKARRRTRPAAAA